MYESSCFLNEQVDFSNIWFFKHGFRATEETDWEEKLWAYQDPRSLSFTESRADVAFSGGHVGDQAWALRMKGRGKSYAAAGIG